MKKDEKKEERTKRQLKSNEKNRTAKIKKVAIFWNNSTIKQQNLTTVKHIISKSAIN